MDTNVRTLASYTLTRTHTRVDGVKELQKTLTFTWKIIYSEFDAGQSYSNTISIWKLPSIWPLFAF